MISRLPVKPAILQHVAPCEQKDARAIGPRKLGSITMLLMVSSTVLSKLLSLFKDWMGGLARMYQRHVVFDVLAAPVALVPVVFNRKSDL